MKRLFISLMAGTFAATSGIPTARAEVVISEFMASNRRTLPGPNNAYPDWIELHNNGTNAVNLGGWFLTDAAGNLTKWRFPATNIAAGAYMIVYADGADRAVPGAPLHANFSLSAGGEYLALVKPDGVTITTQFSPRYPGQAPDVSYGFGTFTRTERWIDSNSLVRLRIPDETEVANWTTNAFDDSTWTLGTNGVGYAATNTVEADYGAAIAPTAPVAFWRLNEASGTTAASTGSGGGSDGTYNSVALGQPGPRPPAFGGFEANNNAPTFNGNGSVNVGSSLLSGRSAFTVAGWVRPASTGNRVGLFGQNDAVEFGFISAGTLQCWTPGGGSVNATYSLPMNTWAHIVAVGNGSTIRIFTNGVLAATGGSGTANYGTSAYGFRIGGGGIFDDPAANGNFFNGQIDEVALYHRALSDTEIVSLYRSGTNASGGTAAQFVRTDVRAAMSNVNASAWIRIPFTVENPTNVSLLTMRLRYDDGFVAYLNGIEVARANAPATLAADSAATGTHSPLAVEEFRFGAAALVTGSNVLAIHGLNVANNDADFLISAQLDATIEAGESSTPFYFTTPTPGAANGSGIANPGPAIFEVTHVPNMPLDHEDLTITAKIEPTFFGISNVVMRYRIMFNTEVETPMFDDGLHGDGAAGDGVYGATIASSLATNGQMIRWYFRATDTNGNVSRWPLYGNPSSSAEYLGTIVNPTNVTSKLPIVHLFVHPNQQSAVDSQAGGRASVFHLGELYDNVQMQLRGNTTAGYFKKSHRVEFNAEHPFRHTGPGPRIRKTSFVADYPDPAYMRQGLAFWLSDQIGAPAPFYEPVRLQLNGEFYQLANHNDVHGEELLERLGYDPNGALYNAAGTAVPGRFSTGGFEKKTRRWDNDSDYAALAAAIAEGLSLNQRRTNVFDLFDVPEVINYLVAARWSHENDDVWANLSLYHDNDGDRLWRVVPFDMNLSWGAIFYEGGNLTVIEGVQATNDIHKAHPLYGTSQAPALSGPSGANGYNRVYEAFFLIPEFREMYLRRLRTMLDTYIGDIGTPTNASLAEQRVLQIYNLIREEALIDRAKWGWPAKGGQCNFNPGINITNGVNGILNDFIRARRNHFYGKHSITNTALAIGVTKSHNAGIPLAQPTNLVLHVGQIEFNPSSGLQGHEFLTVSNPNPIAVDISGWELDGAVRFTFRPGTVLPSNSVIYVTPDIKAWRTRTTGPRPGQGLFVVGDYSGQFDARGETLEIRDPRGRLVDSKAYIGTPSPAQSFLRVTEIMYNPGPTNAGSAYTQQEFEYIELKNIGPDPLNLIGVHFTNGIEFAFTASSAITSLAPGQVVVLVKNPAAFVARYGNTATIAGTYIGSLDNGGERVSIHDAVGEQVLDFSYNNSWYPITDGFGFSLVIVDENAPWNTWDEKESWRPSGQRHGSAGANDPGPVTDHGVLVNELLAHTDPPAIDQVELWNSSTNTVDIGGWFLSDDFYAPFKYRIPDGVTIAPGGYLVLTETQFNPGGTGFAFGADGDDVFIYAADSAGNLTGYTHGFEFAPSENGVSFGRYITSQGDEHFVAQSANTFGAANAGPKVGPIIVSEIMYHPPGNSDLDEYIELHNLSGAAVPLYDAARPTNTWRLDDAVNFEFSTNDVIAAGGYLLVVSFDPATNAAALAAFRAKYGLSPALPIVGPFRGQLANDRDSVELRKPDEPTTNDVPYVLVERVRYRDEAPWEVGADGFGPSLQRIVAPDYANDPTNWLAGIPTPGAPAASGDKPVIVQHPTAITIVEGNDTNLTVVVSGSTPIAYQWRRNGENLGGATNATLQFPAIRPEQSGNYEVVVFNAVGSAISSNVLVHVRALPRIVQQPQSMIVSTGATVTLSVVAAGTGTIDYQWRFNGTNIDGATSANYTFTGADLFEHTGHYDVRVTDEVGTLWSDVATILVPVRPAFTNHPQPTAVVQGGTARFRILAGPEHPMVPLFYRWTRNGAAYPGNGPMLIVTNVQSGGSFRCLVANIGFTNIGSSSATLTVLPDADGDGIPDSWENAYGLNRSNSMDATLDFDGDGMINRDEYIANTIPTNAASVLKLFLSDTNPATLHFIGQSNISYTVQSRPSLTTDTWSNLQHVPKQPTMRTVVLDVPNPVTEPERYFRVVTPEVE